MYFLACVLLCAGAGKQTQDTGIARNMEYQVASVKKDVAYAAQHPILEGPLEDQHISSPALFQLWLAECMTS